jgi:hypothetical protein
MPKTYIGRIWFDVKIVANNFEEAKAAAKTATNSVGFPDCPVDVEIYDVQWAEFFTEDGESIRGRK